MAEMVSLHLAISEMMANICQILASSDFFTLLIPKYTSLQILACVPTSHVDWEK